MFPWLPVSSSSGGLEGGAPVDARMRVATLSAAGGGGRAAGMTVVATAVETVALLGGDTTAEGGPVGSVDDGRG